MTTVTPARDTVTPIQRQAMALKFAGKSYPIIGKELNINPHTIRNWFCAAGALAKPYMAYCEAILNPKLPMENTVTGSKTIADRLKEAAPAALENIIALGGSATREAVKFMANKDILDRAGYMPVNKVLAVHAIEEMSIGQLDEFVGDILEGAKARSANLPIDVPVIDPGQHSGSELQAPLMGSNADIIDTINNVDGAGPDQDMDMDMDSVDIPDLTTITDANMRLPYADH